MYNADTLSRLNPNMNKKMTLFKAPSQNKQISKYLEFGVLLYLIIAAGVFILLPFFAINWSQKPFIGAFTEQTMLFNGIGMDHGDGSWQIFNDDIKLDYRLKEIEGQAVTNSREMSDVLLEYQVGDEVSIVYADAAGNAQRRTVTLEAFEFIDLTSYFIVPYILGLLYLIIGIWIFKLRHTESSGRAFAIFAASLALGAGGLFDVYTTHHFSILWITAIALAGGALIDLSLTFPQEFEFTINRAYIRWAGYIVAAILSIIALPATYNLDAPSLYIRRWQAVYGLTSLSVLFFIVILFVRSRTDNSPVAKQQIRMVWWGITLAFAPISIFMFISFLKPINFNPYLFVPTIVFPIVTGYAILRYRLLKVDYLFSRATLFIGLTLLVALGYGMVIGGLSLILGKRIPASNPWAMGVLITLLALGLIPLRDWLQVFIDRIAFRGGRAYQKQLETFSQELTTALNLDDILKTLRAHIVTGLLPNRLHIYVYDASSNQYAATKDTESNQPTSDIQFTENSPLVSILKKEHLPFYVDPANPPENLIKEESRLSLLGAFLFVPLHSGNQLMGWLALGLRRSGEPYSSHELSFLENIANQAAIAVERAQVVINMQRRVREMNVLTRVSQGVSITLSFDDVLELIFAQATQIIPATDFHITLHNKEGGYFYYAFCLEDNKRLEHQENMQLPLNQGLGQWIAQNIRSVLTQDYTRECQSLNVIPAMQNIYAWMGVPLNAGSEAIGSLSVGSRDPNTTYTRSQLELLQAIADQTAGAITKARLLQETERRARQLSTLNEITRQLTSTLELEPLLKNILENAVSILSSEAGTLFMVDEDTDELIFTVTVGPVADDIIGNRIPAGSGIVGRAVETRAPVVENNTKQSAGWSGSTDQETGFVTHSLLAVPLQVKERVIGVVEVINRRDGLPFAEDDADLLSAFAGQAAVALDNARLYTLTDQELSARVEELSIMQRIDRELNATLEIDRAMRITLEWAMRQSDSEAGLIGILEEEGINIMAQQGYGDQLSLYDDAPLPLELPAMITAIEEGQPQRAILDPKVEGGLLPGTRTQIVIPLRRESQAIGVILLEATIESEADIEFLGRLSDHAAIAISNAQLYAAVEAANVAKSDFVSFVAHELKNPMTSIKGYSELLAAGAVGEVSETQANFLGTIRSNVMRMSTLVTDLSDNSKIEAGRLSLDFKAIELQKIVDSSVRSTAKQIEEKKQTVELEIDEKLPLIWADNTRVEQVMVNLVSNSYKYTPEEGVITIGAEEADNQWDPKGAPKVVHVWVKDDGIGMEEEDQKKIFTKFFRSEDYKARESPGTGLGLNITKSIVEMQGGQIWFESVFREGTTFHFTIPVAEQ